MVAIPGFYEKPRLFARRFEVEDLVRISGESQRFVGARQHKLGLAISPDGFIFLFTSIDVEGDIVLLEQFR
jgi:hypothetical protein